jgi:hypothetical protein
VDPISERVDIISCSEGIEHKEIFSSIEMQLSKRDRRSSSEEGPEEVKTCPEMRSKAVANFLSLRSPRADGSFKKSIALSPSFNNSRSVEKSSI